MGDDGFIKSNTLLNPIRFKILRLILDQNASMFATEIAESLDLDRRLVLYHLRKLEEVGLLSSALIGNPREKSMGRLSRYFKLTDAGKNAFSEMERAFDYLESRADQLDLEKAATSFADRQVIFDKLTSELRVKSRARNANIPNLAREVLLKIGIGIKKLEIRDESLVSITDPQSMKSSSSMFVVGEVQIDNTPIQFSAAIEKDQKQNLHLRKYDIERVVLDRVELDDIQARKEKISLYNKYVRVVAESIVLILESLDKPDKLKGARTSFPSINSNGFLLSTFDYFDFSSVNDIVDTFCPILEELRYDFIRQLNGVQVSYLLDYSEVFPLINPSMIRRDDRSAGYAVQMFRAKRKRDNYILPPAAAWEAIHNVVSLAHSIGRYSDLRILENDVRIRKFLDVVINPPKSAHKLERKLVDLYLKMGGLSMILDLVDVAINPLRIKKSIKRLTRLIYQKQLLPLEEVVPEIRKCGIEEKVFSIVFNFLTTTRGLTRESNLVDALNMSLTYKLNELFYKSEMQYYVLVSHSPIPLSIFRRVEWKNDPLPIKQLVRTPQFMITRALCMTKHAGLESAVKHLEGIDSMKRLRTRLQLIFKSSEQTISVSNNLLTEIYADYDDYYRNFYIDLIKEVLHVEKRGLETLRSDTAITKRLGHIARVLSDREEYLNIMMKAQDFIAETAREMPRILDGFIDENLLVPDMISTLDGIS